VSEKIETLRRLLAEAKSRRAWLTDNHGTVISEWGGLVADFGEADDAHVAAAAVNALPALLDAVEVLRWFEGWLLRMERTPDQEHALGVARRALAALEVPRG
jgi:hypothetical protein